MLRCPLVLLFTAAAFAQAPADPLQALLAEVHQLRMDLQATTITSQRVQILLYRVQIQQAAVIRAANHADETRNRLAEVQRAKMGTAENLRQVQEVRDKPGAPEAAVKSAERESIELKSRLEFLEKDEQMHQSRDIDAQSQLRAEQSKLNGLQDTLDKLDKALEALATRQ
jgi:hypothetical protein